MANQTVIVLRGAPASGKSTIAKYFCFKKDFIWLKVDAFKDFFNRETPETLMYVNEAAIHSLQYFLEKEFSVVMEGVFQNPQTVSDAIHLAKSKGISCHVFEIECSLAILQERDRTREGVKEGYRKPLGDEKIAQIYEAIHTNPLPHVKKLDTENRSIEEIIKEIEQTL